MTVWHGRCEYQNMIVTHKGCHSSCGVPALAVRWSMPRSTRWCAWRRPCSVRVSPGQPVSSLLAQAYFAQTGKDGVSMQSHLTELIHKLLHSKNPKALEELESLSLEVKKTHFDANQPRSKVCRARENAEGRHSVGSCAAAAVTKADVRLLACAPGRAGGWPGGCPNLRTPCPVGF